MKALRIVLITILALVAIFLIIPLFMSSSYNISRSIIIEKPVDFVYRKAADYSIRKQWDPWVEMDANAENSFKVTDGFVGSVWTWKGDTVGSGSMTIVSVEPGKSIASKLVFTAPWESESMVYWKFTGLDSLRTNVVWSNTGELSYLMRYMGSGMDAMLGPQFARGLNNFKSLIEIKTPPVDTSR